MSSIVIGNQIRTQDQEWAQDIQTWDWDEANCIFNKVYDVLLWSHVYTIHGFISKLLQGKG